MMPSVKTTAFLCLTTTADMRRHRAIKLTPVQIGNQRSESGPRQYSTQEAGSQRGSLKNSSMGIGWKPVRKPTDSPRFEPKVLAAVAIIIAGVFVGRWAGRIIDGGIKKFNLDPPVHQLLLRIVRIFILSLFAIMALQNLGVEL